MGPIETIASRQLRGEIGDREALRQVQEPDFVRRLEPTYLGELAAYAKSIAQAKQSAAGLLYLELSIGAVETPDAPAELTALVGTLTVDFVEVASWILLQGPNAALYRRAMEKAERVRTSARDAGDCQLFGNILHALGTLHLDPYVVDRDERRYEYVMRQWASQSPADADAMPSPAEAIRLAEKYYRAATRVRTGPALGRTLKAIVQALGWRGVLGAAVPEDKIKRIARTALPLLDPIWDADRSFFLMAVLSSLGEPVDAQVIERIAAMSLDAQIRRHGAHRAMSMMMNLVNVLAESNPRSALGIALGAQPMFAQFGDGTLRNEWWDSQRIVFRKAYLSAFDPAKDGLVADRVAETRARAQAEHWDEGQLAAALLALASRTPPTDEEPLGIQLLDEVERLAPLTVAPIHDAIQSLRAGLWINVGSNEVKAQHWADAMSAYGRALRLFIDLRVSDLALNCLERIDNLAARGGEKGAEAIATTLEPLAGALEVRLGEPATELLQGIYRSAIGALGDTTVNAHLLNTLVTLAKGRRFGATAASRASVRYREDDDGRDLLGSIDTLLGTMPDYQPGQVLGNPEIEDGEMLLLSPLRRSSMRLEGVNAPERLANLQASFDLHIDRRLAETGGDAPGRLPSIDELRAALDDRTVLLSYFLGAIDSRPALYVMLFTRDETKVAFQWAGEKNERPMTRLVGNFEVSLTGVASGVLATRQAIVADKSEDILGEGSAFLLGHIAPILDAYLKTGKTHLCIAPHGALHYFPFHLLTHDWVVTYLPNVQLLLTQRGQVVGRRAWDYTVTAVGVGFEDEARAIAEVFPGNSMAILGPDATEPALLSALRRSRYVHIAAHGSHNVIAPAFQCVYVSPGAGADGRLYAHELAALDLRGVDLVTLSACETALGRFDIADNLRGLPAMLMLAGVSSIVGTLWPVETEVSQRFFTTLYKTLSTEGATKLEAFAEAQRRARKYHPAYRDWGAFYFAGDWS